ncbi:MAG: N-acetylmuramoyl-L-alanine amidase [Leptolyngbya sp. BL-A-14]
MNRKLLSTVIAVVLCLTTFIGVINSGRSQLTLAQSADTVPTVPLPVAPGTQPAIPQPEPASTACALQPDKGSVQARTQAMLKRRAQLLASGAFDLSRFRQASKVATQTGDKGALDTAQADTGYTPREQVAFIDPSNYGDRFLNDINGNPADLEPIIVLHETVGSASSALGMFQAFHRNDDDQVSYHTLIKRDGTLVYLVPPDKRAFGAGNSAFMGANGLELVKTHPSFPGSVNNFAYHISLETPYDGNHNGYTHSGYTQAQYSSLAWLVAKTGVADERITTHKAVDRSRSRIDPRSFNNTTFFSLLRAQPRTADIAIRCTDPTRSSVQPQ